MNAKTTTATKAPVAETQAPSERNEVAIFQPPRLPFHQAIKERFGIEPSGWKALVEAVFPNAKTVDAIVMALSYCKARNLDVFKRPVHIVGMWDSKLRREVETIWPGIAELRTTAARTGNYAGCDEAEFGPIISRSFSGKMKVGRDEYKDTTVTLEFPEWCRLTVYRLMPNGQRCKFVGPKVKWLESYAAIGRSDLPNEMWKDRAEGQLEKCAEAAALRRAFPEELGNDLTADEMAGRTIHEDGAEPIERVQTSAGPPPPSAVKSGAAPAETTKPAQDEVIDVEAEEIEAIAADDENPAPAQPATQQATPTQPTMITMDERDWLNELSGAFSGCEDLQHFTDTQKKIMAPSRGKVTAEAWARAQHLAEDAYKRVSANG